VAVAMAVTLATQRQEQPTLAVVVVAQRHLIFQPHQADQV
jgi:hypothetical protein